MKQGLKIGLAGLGTVGAQTARIVKTKPDMLAAAGQPMSVVAVSARHKTEDRAREFADCVWYYDPVDLATSPDIDLFVELIGGESGPALAAVEAALQAGRHVVTANKAMLARHGVHLAKLAEKNGVTLAFEAAVAGGIPVVKALRESLRANEMTRIFGILNGTSNYILTRMEKEGHDFDAVLKDAQALGYAEADPTADIAGYDTAHKLALLASLAFGTEVDYGAIYIEGISKIAPADIAAAAELGYRIKLLGVAVKTDTGIEARVHPTMVERNSAIARIDGVTNAVAIDGDQIGEVLLVGPGAGGEATASAVVGDLVDIAAGRTAPAFGVPTAKLQPAVRAPMRAHEGGYYVRLSVFDRPGAFAQIAQRMADNDISLESIVQHGGRAHRHDSALPIILITHETTEARMRNAFAAIKADGHIEDEPRMIRIERA